MINKTKQQIISTILDRPIELSYMEISQCLFECKRCGKCCTGMKGIHLDNKDISLLSHHLKHGPNWFKKNYVDSDIASPDEMFLKGSLTGGRCPFYSDEINGCSVHTVRPKICRVFPLFNPEREGMRPHWYEDCPGVVDLVKEIYYHKLTNPKPEDLSPERMKLMSLLRIIAHLEANKQAGLRKDIDRHYKGIDKMFKPWSDKLRPFGIDFLARAIELNNIEDFLKAVEEKE